MLKPEITKKYTGPCLGIRQGFPWGGEQRKSEERNFRRFARAKNGARAKQRKKGEGERREGNACRQTSGFCKPPT